MNEANLTKAEKAVLSEFMMQHEGWALLSYAWLRDSIRGHGLGEHGEKISEQALNRILRRFEKWKLVKHIVAPDHGAWYVLREAWDQVDPRLQEEIRTNTGPRGAHGAGGRVSILVLNPPNQITIYEWKGNERVIKGTVLLNEGTLPKAVGIAFKSDAKASGEATFHME